MGRAIGNAVGSGQRRRQPAAGGGMPSLWRAVVAEVHSNGSVFVTVPRMAGQEPVGPMPAIPSGLIPGEAVIVGAVAEDRNDLIVLSRLNTGGLTEPAIPAGTTAQYWRGDKTWATLNKTAVGLDQVDNTNDLAKPISTATATALAGKAATTHNHSGTQITSGTIPAARLPAVTTTANGAMLFADKVKLDAATGTATGSTLALRGADGGVQFFRTIITETVPNAANQATRKDYVDAQDALKADVGHSHALLDSATGSSSASTLVKRFADGSVVLSMVKLDNAPATASEATRKDYVDGQVATRAAAAHTHAWADIASGVPTTFAPSAHTHAAADVASGTLDPARLPTVTGLAQGAMTASDKLKLDGAGVAASPSSLVLRDASGKAQFATPTIAADAATKGYVDTAITGVTPTDTGWIRPTMLNGFTGYTGGVWDGVWVRAVGGRFYVTGAWTRATAAAADEAVFSWSTLYKSVKNTQTADVGIVWANENQFRSAAGQPATNSVTFNYPLG